MHKLRFNSSDMKNFISDTNIQISYNTYGDHESKEAILFFHGFPGSHLQGAFLDKRLKDLKKVMLAVDRPGYGNSSWINPLNWDQAVRAYGELLNSLGFDKIVIMGVSGGSPMAHMSASLLNDRVQQLIVICGLASFSKMNRPSFTTIQSRLLNLSKLIPSRLLKLLLDYGLSSFRPEKRLQHLVQTLHKTDQEVLSAPHNQDLLMQSMKWGRNQGSSGVVWDSQIFNKDWLSQYCNLDHFEKFPTLYFHGENDFLLDPKMSQLMQKSVPRSSLKLIAKQGHYSLPMIEHQKIFEAICGI